MSTLRYDPTPLRWIELGIPVPGEPERLWRLKADGPFSLRHSYRVPGAEEEAHLHLDQRTQNGGLNGCLSCGQPELFTRKRFPRSWGIAIVVVAAILAPFTNYLSLAAAAVLDWVLYQFAEEELVCYACEGEHRGFANEPLHPRFDRTIAERLSYGEKAVMGSPMRPGGTGGAPDPEH